MSVRLFASARHAAGFSTIPVAGSTVREVLDEVAARAQSPEALIRVMTTAALFCDGVRATLDTEVAPGVEVAVVPPVSGG